jgi:hypothetical protein
MDSGAVGGQVSRITYHVSRITYHVSRITYHVSRVACIRFSDRSFSENVVNIV